MHGHYEDITKVDFTLTEPSQMIGWKPQGFTQVGFLEAGSPACRGEGGVEWLGGPLWSPAVPSLAPFPTRLT
jgi:hypothetical protein